MRYRLKTYTIHELGQRSNQEDSLYPKHEQATDTDRLFILCDGMGGHSAGEVASRIVCETMSKSIFESCPDAEGEFADDMLKDAISDAYDALDEADDGAEKKMGTTMTFLKFHKDGCTIAHIGDSRVYHVRPGADREHTQILFQTSDHSLVNDLIKIGELTPEEAKHSRQKNVITRAMQPLMERRCNADIHHVDDIRPGDYFMLCSDGILENYEDDNIRYIFSDEGGSIAEKVEIIVKGTEHNKDNHTAFVIRVESVEEDQASTPAEVSIEMEPQAADRKEFKIQAWMVAVVVTMLAAAIALIVPKLRNKDRHDEMIRQSEQTIINSQTEGRSEKDAEKAEEGNNNSVIEAGAEDKGGNENDSAAGQEPDGEDHDGESSENTGNQEGISV